MKDFHGSELNLLARKPAKLTNKSPPDDSNTVRLSGNQDARFRSTLIEALRYAV